MYLDQRKALVNDMRVRKVGGEFVHRSLGVFAMRALEVCELDQFKLLASRAARGAVGALEQHVAIFGVRVRTERKNFAGGDDVLAVSQSKELQRTDLLVAFFADCDDDVADAWNRGLGDALHLVDALGVKTPRGLQKGDNLLLGGRVGGKINGLGLGESRLVGTRLGWSGRHVDGLWSGRGVLRKGIVEREPEERRKRVRPTGCGESGKRDDESIKRISPFSRPPRPSRAKRQPLGLYLNAGGYGKPAPHSKGLAGDLEHGRSLLAFVLGTLDQVHYMFDDFRGKTVRFGDLRGGLVALDVGLEDRVEDFIGRQRVGVLFWSGRSSAEGALVRMASGMISRSRFTQRLSA